MISATSDLLPCDDHLLKRQGLIEKGLVLAAP
jgi:hypothetical protein